MTNEELLLRIFALELNNDVCGLGARKQYIENLIAQLDMPGLVVLPELAICGYAGSETIWQYADLDSKNTSEWAMMLADKYNTAIGIGYVETDGQDYYNSYMIADKNTVFGIVRKCEGESYIFKRGDFSHVISTPFGNIAVGICYDSRRKHLYDAIKNEEISLILFPHGSPADPKKSDDEKCVNDTFCNAYVEAFGVSVVYVNSTGKMPPMLGITGKMMRNAGFALNGLSKIYSRNGTVIETNIKEAIGIDVILSQQTKQKDIQFYGNDINKGNFLFRNLVLKPDIRAGIRFYEQNKSC